MPDTNLQAEPAQMAGIETAATELHLLRAMRVRLFPHSEGVAITDRETGAVTVLDAALVRSAYDLVMRDRLPVIDAREVQGS